MFKELFFVFKSDAKEEEEKVAFERLADEKTEEIYSFLEAEPSIELALFDEEDSFFYKFVVTESEFNADKVQELKGRILNGEFDFDILISEGFPVAESGAGALVMDMDMTTVQIEGIDEIARRVGVYEEVSAVTEEAMRGNLEFAESLRRRVSLLKGGDAEAILNEVRSIMPETPGLKQLLEFCGMLRQESKGNFKVCIASGGFHDLISVIDERYGLDEIRANRLGIENGKFTGEVDGDIVDGAAKASLVRDLKAAGIPKKNIIVLGDGANDIPMMSEAGLGIAYRAKPKVQLKMLNCLNVGNLSAVKYLLLLSGLRDFE